MTDKDRMARADDYVFGRMGDKERERAEHDMEIDDGFRDAVAALALRLYSVKEQTEAGPPAGIWQAVEAGIATMPQMQRATPAAPVVESAAPVKPAADAAGGWRILWIVLSLIAAFALGFLSGRF